MKAIKTKTGKIQLLATLASMEVGDTWTLRRARYKPSSLRVACSNYGTAVNKMFTVCAPSDKATITITRTK